MDTYRGVHNHYLQCSRYRDRFLGSVGIMGLCGCDDIKFFKNIFNASNRLFYNRFIVLADELWIILQNTHNHFWQKYLRQCNKKAL